MTIDYYWPRIYIFKLNPTNSAYYQSLIWILWWMIELGCVDITTEVSMLLSYLALLREGHLKELFCIISYLESQQNNEMVFDHTCCDID